MTIGGYGVGTRCSSMRSSLRLLSIVEQGGELPIAKSNLDGDDGTTEFETLSKVTTLLINLVVDLFSVEAIEEDDQDRVDREKVTVVYDE